MARVFSFPFRLGSDGSIAKVDESSDQAVEEAIAIALLTNLGERIQVPTFGARDPAFTGVEAGALQRHLNDFGPVGVIVSDIAVQIQPRDTEQVVVSWERAEQDVSPILTNQEIA